MKMCRSFATSTRFSEFKNNRIDLLKGTLVVK
jgi:hypothetical protein